MLARRLSLEGLQPSEVGPGKGCPAAFGVLSADAYVSVIAGEADGHFWIATWEDAHDTSAISEPYRPGAALTKVRSCAAALLAGDPSVSNVNWLTFREWAANGRQKSGL
jgi:hypothetical protein